MGKKIRPIEMYIGFGTDFGTWITEYVDIPIDTPENKIEELAKNMARNNFKDSNDFVFVGVYSIIPLEELDDFYEDYI